MWWASWWAAQWVDEVVGLRSCLRWEISWTRERAEAWEEGAEAAMEGLKRDRAQAARRGPPAPATTTGAHQAKIGSLPS